MLKANQGCCEEAAMGQPGYIPCNRPAVNIVGWKGRDDKPIPMCEMCTDHNVRNRGGEIIRKYDGPAPIGRMIPAVNRNVAPSDNKRSDAEKIDYAALETERLREEYAGLIQTLDRLRNEAKGRPVVTDDATMTAVGGIIKRLRDLRGELEKTRVVETEPHLRRKNAGDSFFGAMYDEIQPDKRPGQRPKPGLIDELQADINRYQDAKEAALRAEREAAERKARAEREAAELLAKQQREAAEKAEREARELQEKAERARNEETRKKAAAEAKAAAETAAAAAAKAKEAEVVVEQKTEAHQDAHIDTLAKSADLVRTHGTAPESGGVLNTVKTEKIAELTDRSLIDDATKILLFDRFTDVEVAKAVRSFAVATAYRTPLPGCLITIRKSGVTR